MNDSVESDQDCPPAPTFKDGVSRELRIVNRKGLHARATAKFVQCVERYDAEVTVTRCGDTVGGMSIMGILTLGAGIGSTITVSARGSEASDCLEAITQLVANRFGEDE
ncbi:MAG: HPr family phosphocarrier protein [Beijerinckiaceae bacterium]|jgi:phosphocarrier protein HPr|nr:HPr family phosphocarrier protein [Beijerinckiaceae bacterium]MDO9440788.1 HPr family phosphocarrier protein [Beijerinckiaceae bacterium]